MTDTSCMRFSLPGVLCDTTGRRMLNQVCPGSVSWTSLQDPLVVRQDRIDRGHEGPWPLSVLGQAWQAIVAGFGSIVDGVSRRSGGSNAGRPDQRTCPRRSTPLCCHAQPGAALLGIDDHVLMFGRLYGSRQRLVHQSRTAVSPSRRYMGLAGHHMANARSMVSVSALLAASRVVSRREP
jgi:hypothetical protein